MDHRIDAVRAQDGGQPAVTDIRLQVGHAGPLQRRRRHAHVGGDHGSRGAGRARLGQAGHELPPQVAVGAGDEDCLAVHAPAFAASDGFFIQ